MIRRQRQMCIRDSTHTHTHTSLPPTFQLDVPSPVQLHQLQLQLPLFADVLDGGDGRLESHGVLVDTPSDALL